MGVKFKIRTWVELVIVLIILAISAIHIIAEINTFYLR
jgi:hypothetical protein